MEQEQTTSDAPLDGYAESVHAWNMLRELADAMKDAVNISAFADISPRAAHDARRRSLRIARRIVEHLERSCDPYLTATVTKSI